MTKLDNAVCLTDFSCLVSLDPLPHIGPISSSLGSWAFSLRLKRAFVHYDRAMSERIKQILVLVVTWAGIIVPFSAAISNFTPGGAADTFGLDPLVTPSPYAFLIWAPIYLGLLALAVYQALPDREEDARLKTIRPWLALTAVLNAIWLYAVADGRLWLPVLTIFALLATALALRYAFGIGVRHEGVMRWLGYSVSIYAGWLTLATIVNTSSALLLSGWTSWAPFWAIVMLLVGAIIGLTVRVNWCDPVYGGVFVWTFLAIAIGQWGHPLVIIVSLLLMLGFAATLLPPLLRGRQALS